MNKKNIVIASVITALVIILIVILLIATGNGNKNNNKIIEKESVIISGSEYVVFDTTELILDSNNISITDMKNISKLENLEKLDISKSEIDDVTFLSNLTKLTSLKINVSPKLTDYSALGNLNNLFTLEIYGNIGQLSNMEFLGKLSKLNTLYLTFESDRDVEFIKKCSNLSILSLDVPVDSYNKIDKMLELNKIVIKTHGNLAKVDLSESKNVKIEDGIINWSSFDVDNTTFISINLTDEYKDINKLQGEIDKLKNYKNLVSLDIHANVDNSYSINNFDFLSDLTKLENLTINYLNANDISALSNLVNLKKLYITNGNMANSKFNSISNLENIVELNLNMENITDISFLKNFKKLEKLYLNGNDIKDITPLKDLSNLKELYIGCNKNLLDITAIKNLTKLENFMYTTAKFDITLLSNLKSLKNLYLGVDFSDVQTLKKTYPNINVELLSECV